MEQLERSLQQAGSGVASCKLSDLVFGDCSWYDYFGCPRWWTCVCSGNPQSSLETKRVSLEELELRHVVFLGSSLARKLRALMEKARTNVDDMLNVHLTHRAEPSSVEQTAVLHAQSEYERREQPEETAERARGRGCRGVEGILSEYYEPKTATRGMSECSDRFFCMTSGSSHNSFDRIEQFRHLVRKYEGTERGVRD